MTMPCSCISGDVGLCTQCELSRLRSDLKFFQDSSDEMTAEVLKLRAENAELKQYVAGLHGSGWTPAENERAELDWFKRREPSVRRVLSAVDFDKEATKLDIWESANPKPGA